MQKKVLPILFATLLLDTIGFGMVFPIIPIIFTDPASPAFLLTGYSQSMQFLIAGGITAVFGLMTFIAAPLLGELSDVYGRKRLLTIGVAILALSQFVFGFGIELALVPVLFIARAIAGMAAANISIAQAAIADVSRPEERAKNFGLIGAAFGIGFILGPLLSGWIAGVSGNPAFPFWAAGILGLMNVAFISLFLPETHLRRSEKKAFTIFKGIHNIIAALEDKEAMPVYFANFLYMSGFSFFVSFIGILLVSQFTFTETAVGTFFAVVGACIVISQLVVLRILVARFSERAIIRFSLLMVAAVMVTYPFLPNGTALFIMIPFLAIPQGVSMANLTALISKSVSPAKQGAALGINGSVIALAQGVIPLIAGVGSGFVGIKLPFIAGSILIILAWSSLFLRKQKRDIVFNN
ncbi:MAG TPA: MFS transporter [Patescibacteria group bacterium]|nr:MFS transporter [Patescibacteria group bacterium]